MKIITKTISIVILTILLFNLNSEARTLLIMQIGKINENSFEKEEIQNLIKNVLTWADSKNTIDLLPAIKDSSDSIYIGFDFDKIKLNLDKLRKTNMFSEEFIENYNEIILTLDKNIKDKIYPDWLVGDIQPFGFANDVNPWCYCQETPEYNSKPSDFVEVTIVNLEKDKGELTWTWGKTDWRDIKYKFRVIKENGKWKIAYMQGFDYKEAIKED